MAMNNVVAESPFRRTDAKTNLTCYHNACSSSADAISSSSNECTKNFASSSSSTQESNTNMSDSIALEREGVDAVENDKQLAYNQIRYPYNDSKSCPASPTETNADNCEIPIDLSCHNRNTTASVATNQKESRDTTVTNMNSGSRLLGNTHERLKAYRFNTNEQRSSVQKPVSPNLTKPSAPCENMDVPVTSEINRNSYNRQNYSNSCKALPHSLAYSPSLFTWPYLMSTVSASLRRFSHLSANLPSDMFFLPRNDSVPVTKNASFSRSHLADLQNYTNPFISDHRPTVNNFCAPPMLQPLFGDPSILNRAMMQEPYRLTNGLHSLSSLHHRPTRFSDVTHVSETQKAAGARNNIRETRYTGGQKRSYFSSFDTSQNKESTKVPKLVSKHLLEKISKVQQNSRLFPYLPTTSEHNKSSCNERYGGVKQSINNNNTDEKTNYFKDHISPRKRSKTQDSNNNSIDEAKELTSENASKSPTSLSSNATLQPRQPVNFQPCKIRCSVCGRSYATLGALAKHAKTHENSLSNSAFNCKICKKECSTLGALRMHIRTHTLPCECHICGKAFSRTWLLQGHIRTHTGEKPYECSVCSRAFADRSNLRAHMQTHELVKRYSCENCEKTFSRISLLKRHQIHCGSSSGQSNKESP